ncbi:hypothetical protein I4U23_027597 [Adineta vaga]|nr:hypothetical protein I4U23_027597 [Adineta vaga]
MASSLYIYEDTHCESPNRKRRCYERKHKVQKPYIPNISKKNEELITNNFNDSIKQAEQDLEDSKRRKQQTLCMELSSFLFDIFCQQVILPKLLLADDHDWFFDVRDVLHREYTKKELLDKERELVKNIKKRVTADYLSQDQWFCLLNLNVSMGQPCGHRSMNPNKLSKEVKELASKWLEGEAQQTVQALIKAVEKSHLLSNSKQLVTQHDCCLPSTESHLFMCVLH